MAPMDGKKREGTKGSGRKSSKSCDPAEMGNFRYGMQKRGPRE